MIDAAPIAATVTAFDFQGLAILLGALSAFIIAVGGFAMQVVTFVRQGQMASAGKARDIKLAEVHDLVNGQSEKLAKAIEKGAFAEGVKAEVDRAAALAPTPTAPAAKT